MNPLVAVQAGLGVAQTVQGFIQKGKAKKELSDLVSQRKAFETEQGTYDLRNSAAARVADGMGSSVRSYLTGQVDRSFAATIGASVMSGGDANDLAGAHQRTIDAFMQIGAKDTAAGLDAYGKYMQAQDTLNKSNEAEQISRDNLLKDSIQAKSAEVTDAAKGIQSGLNGIVGGIAAGEQMKLFNDQTAALKGLGGAAANLTPVATAVAKKALDTGSAVVRMIGKDVVAGGDAAVNNGYGVVSKTGPDINWKSAIQGVAALSLENMPGLANFFNTKYKRS